MRAGKVCRIPGCPLISDQSLCTEHRAARDLHARLTTPTKRTRTYTEQKRRAAAVAQHRRTLGNWCPGWGRRPAHPSADLTADHDVAVAAGGAPDGPLTVRCRGCNSSKGDR